MTEQEYLAQNALGFEGDTFLRDEFERLIKKHNIKTIIETGTYMGATARKLAEMVEEVITIEINPEYAQKAKAVSSTPRPVYKEGNSVDLLPGLLRETDRSRNIICWLDAHWSDYNPLLDELSIIADDKRKPVTIIHDFKVPNHPELGYDSYKGQDYDWEWIKERVENIYGPDGYTYHYNSQATGAMRGVIFIEPK